MYSIAEIYIVKSWPTDWSSIFAVLLKSRDMQHGRIECNDLPPWYISKWFNKDWNKYCKIIAHL